MTDLAIFAGIALVILPAILGWCVLISAAIRFWRDRAIIANEMPAA